MKGKGVKRALWFCLLVGASLVFLGCAGAQPIQKGDTMRCPSCGAEFKAEEGVHHGNK